MPTMSSSNPSRPATPCAPRDAVAVAAMLKGMGFEKYEPAVVHMLVDVMHGHVTGLLHTARGLADHAGKPEIDMDDLRLAASTQRAPPQIPGRSAVLALARERNAVPLPLIPSCGVCAEGEFPLPPKSEWLQPQLDIDIELPPEVNPRATAPEGPWVVSAEERKEIEEKDLQRRRSAMAAANAAASAQAAARAIAVANAAKAQRPADSSASAVAVGMAGDSATPAALPGLPGGQATSTRAPGVAPETPVLQAQQQQQNQRPAGQVANPPPGTSS